MRALRPLAIDLRNVAKSYGSVRALRGVSLSVARGETIALIGPNGAGKSTLLEIIMGLKSADSGEVQVLGENVVANPRAHVTRIGVQLQDGALFGKLSAREYFEFFRGIYATTLPVDELSELLGLADFLDKRIEALSGGQKRRVALALAIVNDPELIILDEPTVGLDPLARRELWSVIERLQKSGKTVLFSTHYMEEASALADTISFIARGKILAQGSAQDLIDRADGASSLDEAYGHFATHILEEGTA